MEILMFQAPILLITVENCVVVLGNTLHQPKSALIVMFLRKLPATKLVYFFSQDEENVFLFLVLI